MDNVIIMLPLRITANSLRLVNPLVKRDVMRHGGMKAFTNGNNAVGALGIDDDATVILPPQSLQFSYEFLIQTRTVS